MITTKAQGQTLKPVAIYLSSPVFPQGQLHVIFNHSSSFDSVVVANIEDYRQRIDNDRLIKSLYQNEVKIAVKTQLKVYYLKMGSG
jgi:hypothetical protein